MFNHLKVPESWNSYFSKYPNGLTIMEALVDWVGQVDSMVDHINTVDEHIDYLNKNLEEFYLTFQDNLSQEIMKTLQAWIEDGTLGEVIAQLIEGRMVFQNIQALQAAPNVFKLGTVVEILGYYTAGDGAGHKRIISDSDDGSGVQVGSKWANYIIQNKNIQTKHIDEAKLKEYLETCSDSLTIDFGKTAPSVATNFVFAGKKNLNIKNLNAKGVISTISIVDCENIVFDNLVFDGSGTESSLYVGQSNNTTITNCTFKNINFGPRLYSDTLLKPCKNIHISNCHFEDMSNLGTWAGAIYIDGQGKQPEETGRETNPIENLTISNNTFVRVGTGGVNLGGAKKVTITNNIFDSSTPSHSMNITMSRETTDVIISANTFRRVGWECIVVNYSSKVNITGNYFEDFGYGVMIETQSKEVVVSNNIFDGKKGERTFQGDGSNGFQSKTYCVGVSNVNNVLISGNVMKKGNYGVMLANNANDITISNNRISECSEGVGIDNISRENITIKNNNIRDCGFGITANAQNTVCEISGNTIQVTSKAIVLQTSSANSTSLIKDNLIVSGSVAISTKPIYNGSGKIEITRNRNVGAAVAYEKYGIQNWSGNVFWKDNKGFVFNKDTIIETFVDNSILEFDEANLASVPTGQSAGLTYYLGKWQNGTVCIMSDNVWKRKTGGGGATPITTVDM